MDNDPIYSPQVPFNPHHNVPVEKQSKVDKVGNSLVDFIQTLVLFGAIFAIIYLFIAQPHKVAGNSMIPIYQDGNYILTDKLSYRFEKPQRGQVIVLKKPQNVAPIGRDEDFIKRIIGLPGDIVKVFGGKVYINDLLIDEKYLPIGRITPPNHFLKEGQMFKIPDNQYIVMGDNREASSDSREWGTIVREEIIGKVFFRYWPLNKFGITIKI